MAMTPRKRSRRKVVLIPGKGDARGRQTKATRERQKFTRRVRETFLAAIREGDTQKDACARAGVSPKTVRYHRDKEIAFAKAYASASTDGFLSVVFPPEIEEEFLWACDMTGKTTLAIYICGLEEHWRRIQAARPDLYEVVNQRVRGAWCEPWTGRDGEWHVPAEWVRAELRRMLARFMLEDGRIPADDA